MAHAFLAETNQIISHLEDAYTKILAINNPNLEWLKTKILMDTKRHIDALKLQLGQDPVATTLIHDTGPLKKMFGKDITSSPDQARDVNKPFKQTAEDVEAAELDLKVDQLYPRILSTPSDSLLDSISDLEIRGIARRAGLPVTETTPVRITTAYIDQIKEAIRQQSSGLPAASNEIGLSRSREQLYSEFSTLDHKEILDIYSDTEVREVAKMAGLPVTKSSPAQINKKFVDQIKGAIKKKRELEDLSGNV